MTAATGRAGTAMVAENLVEALANLWMQRRRSGLALLGIVIGAASIVAMINVGHMAQRESMKLFSQMGVDMLQIQALPSGDAPPGFARADIDQLPQRVPGIAARVPLAVGRGPVRAGGQQTDLGIAGIPPQLARLAHLPIAQGRALGAIDACVQSAVVGAVAAAKLSAPGSAIVPGSTIVVGDYAFRVVGLLAPVPIETLNPTDYNDAILLPIACIRRVLPGAEANVVLIRVAAGQDPEAVGTAAKALLERPGAALQVLSARDIIRTMNQQKQVHTRLLAATGAIALLVGGIGVMNVMLMSTIERRREIGLRVAVGARPRDVQMMFVIEAAVLTLAGGLAGALTGVGIAYGIARGSGWDFAIAGWTIPASAGLSAVMGIVFGAYPAITASRLDPIVALRDE